MKKYAKAAMLLILASASLVGADDTWTPRIPDPGTGYSIFDQLSQIWHSFVSFF